MTEKKKRSPEEIEEIARRRDVNEHTVVCLVAMVLIVLMAVASMFTAG
ncbi:hypothetical protein LCGC14_2008000 [marine sediment metagenome]|uniref:Uncharacterized protein n=1 Tax=marine sediment metagenome TaxID=412755 RepID=A0A0F9F1A6_9ZZZZ